MKCKLKNNNYQMNLMHIKKILKNNCVNNLICNQMRLLINFRNNQNNKIIMNIFKN